MRKYILGISGLLFVGFGLTITSWKKENTSPSELANSKLQKQVQVYHNHIKEIYDAAHLSEKGLELPVFEKAVTGFYNLNKSGDSTNNLLTIADFDQPSTQKRLYIIDLSKEQLVLNTWVAHGQGTGENEAIKFSNINDSYTSSIGFYRTGEEYRGVHGRSLRLDGLDSGYNDNARLRSIVIHGAPYVSAETIAAIGRLGRSQGCPAVSPDLSDQVINTLGEGSVFFINSSKGNYHSTYLNETLAANISAADSRHMD